MLDEENEAKRAASERGEKGSGLRYNADKPPLELIPPAALESAARVFGYGATKYSAYNWANGMSWQTVIGCLLRHVAAIQKGEDVDPESGELHIGHVLCNAMMLAQYYETYLEGDDRPKMLRPAAKP